MSSSTLKRGLIAVHAHPDDETITTGGTLARYAADGVRTIVVTCTRGDLGEVRDPRLRGERDVGTLRQHELRAATGVLGVSRLVELGYGDSGMAGWSSNDRPEAFCRAPLDEAAGRIVDVFREERPSVLLAYDETGGYGHPDHVRAHEVAVAAYQAAPPECRPERLFFVRFPVSISRAFVAALRTAGIDAPGSAIAGADAGRDLIGVPDALVTTRIDIRAFLQTKLDALRRHASQMPPDHFLMRMPLALARDVWRYEHFSLEAGLPASNDDLFGFAS